MSHIPPLSKGQGHLKQNGTQQILSVLWSLLVCRELRLPHVLCHCFQQVKDVSELERIDVFLTKSCVQMTDISCALCQKTNSLKKMGFENCKNAPQFPFMHPKNTSLVWFQIQPPLLSLY